MVEARKCVRCGSLYIADTEVCGGCQKKDGVDLYKLKGFIENQGNHEITQNELSVATGISNKNLSRFLNYDEFKDICVEQKSIAASTEEQSINGISELL